MAVIDLKKLKSETYILLKHRIFFVNLYCKKHKETAKNLY